MKIRTIFAGITASTILVFGAPASADSITVELSTEFSGATAPEGAAPWVEFTFDDGGTAGSVDFTIEATNLINDEFIAAFYFNYNPARSAAALGLSNVDSSEADLLGAVFGNNCCSADGAGLFDIYLNFATSAVDNLFQAGETFTFTLAMEGITASDFNFLNSGPGGNCCWTAAAHIQSIGLAGESGWIGGPTDEGEVPEPGTLALLGLGLTMMGVASRRRRRV